jgi:hypothetical protein
VAARRVYVSAPVAGFDPQAYERVLTVFRSRGAEVVSSRALFGSSEQWVKGFREALDGCTDLLVLLGPDRVIGAGTLREVAEARARALSVWFVQRNGAIRPVHGVWLQFLPGRSKRRTVVVNFEPRPRHTTGAPGAGAATPPAGRAPPGASAAEHNNNSLTPG